jgi:4-amino-4-deoxy-L-arabinose transferase-like glycosyltransferase
MNGKSLSSYPLVLPLLWIGGLAWLVFFYRLGNTGFLDETEPLFTEAARQMTVTGNWITPYFNEVTRFDKPPLIYWFMAICYQLFGTTEWAARLPSAIAATLLTGFSFYTIKRITQQQFLPYLVSAIVALNLQNWFFGRLGYSDMLLSICFGGSLFSFFLGYTKNSRWYWAFYVLMALGVLTKGPVGIVLPSAIALIFLFCVRKLNFREIKVIPGLLIFLLISIPWYVLAYIQNGSAFIDSFFGIHNAARFTSVVNQHSGPWYYHSLIVLGGCFPWSLCLPAAIARVLKQRPWTERTQQLGLFALIWFGVVLGFFTIAVTKYITYTLPLVPAVAILVGLWWNDQDRQSLALKLTVFVSIVFSVALAICSLYSPQWLMSDPDMPKLGLGVQAAGLPIVGAAIWGSTAIAAVILWIQRKLDKFWAVSLAAMVAFIVLFVTPAFGVLDTERQLPLRQIAEMVKQVRQPNEAIVMATSSFEKPSLVFYTQRPITFLTRSSRLKPFLKEQKAKSLLLITTLKTLREAKINPKTYRILQSSGVYQLVRVESGKSGTQP